MILEDKQKTMKSPQKLFFILLIFTTFSCDLFNLEEEPPEDPKASGIYECFINGEPFIAKGPAFENQFGANPITRHTELSGNFQFSISNREMNQWLRIGTAIDSQIGSYSLSEIPTTFIDLSRTECNMLLTYNLLSDSINYVNVTFIDTEHNIIAADFECYLDNECILDTLHVIGHLERDYIF